MAFNDIRIPRVPDKTFKEIKRLAKKDRIHIHQKALQLIELGILHTERHCPYDGYRFPLQSEINNLSHCELSKEYFKNNPAVKDDYDKMKDWITVSVKDNLAAIKEANKKKFVRVKIDK